MDAEELVTVYTESNPVRAEIIKNALQAEEIPCTLEGENQATSGFSGLPIKVQVPAAYAVQAREFIKRHEHTAQAAETP